jgi:hypothetical protein
VIERRTGERRGRSINLESLPTGSVVYVGRDSFRMETVDFSQGQEDDGTRGVVRAAPLVTTAPYGIDTRTEGHGAGRVIIELDQDMDRAVSSASWRAPQLDSLFASQDEAPRLDAPTGQAVLPALEQRATVQVSRAALAGVVGLMFAGGVATASLVRPTGAPAPAPAVSELQPVVIATPIEITAEPEQAEEPPAELVAAPEPSEATAVRPAKIQVEAPVKIRLAKRPAPQVAAAPVPSAGVEAPAQKWVDPFAD